VWYGLANNVSEQSTVVAVKDQVSSNLSGEVVILNLSAGMYYGLDEVGARIWELLQEPRTVSEIQETISMEYDVERSRVDHDVVALLQRLSDEKLIEVRITKST
jgi:hypothetical protein